MAVLFGRYEYVAELGRGATSRVLRVRDRFLRGAPRALKVVGPDDGIRLGWELLRLCEVEHPHVARVHELLRVEEAVHAPFALIAGSFVLVEDLAAGEPVDLALEPLRGSGSGLLSAVFRVALLAAEALAAVHRAGLVHGDVKPANVLCTRGARQVTLIDLGAARAPGFYAYVQGTPDFLAPEAWAGTCSFAQDTYALGAMLFDLWCGEKVDQAATDAGPSFRVRDVAALPREVPAAFHDLLRRMLSADPEVRPADGARVLAQLHALGRRLHLGVPRSAALYATGRVAATPRELSARALCLPFVGHANLRHELEAALSVGRVVPVVGPAGSGRTRLIREALRALQLERAQQGQPTPTLLPDLDAAERIEASCAVAHQVLAARTDVDRALRAVAAWRRRGHFLSVVLELSEPSAVESEVPSIVVPALLPEDERALLAAALGTEPSARACEAARLASGGYAGRLCALLSQGLGEGRSLLKEAEWTGLSLPNSWLGSLGGDALRLARLLSLASDSLTFDAVSACLGGAERAVSAHAELRSRGLLADDLDGVVRLHQGVARRVRAELGSESNVCSKELAASLPDSARSCWACWLRGEVVEGEALLLDAVARARADGDPRAACALLTEALQWSNSDALRLPLADAQRALGRYTEARTTLSASALPEARLLQAELARLLGELPCAEALLEPLVKDARPVVGERARSQLARVRLDRGARDEAAELTVALPADTLARLRVLEVRALLSLSGAEPSSRAASALLVEARSSGDGRALGRALLVSSQAAFREGRVRQAADDLREALVCARAAGEAHEAATIATNLALVELDAGELGPALATLREGAAALVWLGREGELARALYNLGNAAWLIGDASLAETTLAEARERSVPGRDPDLDACLAIVDAELLLHRGQLDKAYTWLALELERLPAHAATRCVLACRTACAAVAAQRAAEGVAALEQARHALVPHDPVQSAELAVARVRELLSRGDAHGAERVASLALSSWGERLPYEAKLRLLLSGVDSAHAERASASADGRMRQCRVLIEHALAGLEPDARALFRALPAQQRVLSHSVPDPASTLPAVVPRGRQLVMASRRLFEAKSDAQLARMTAELALELVQAERALVVAQAADGSVHLLASACLGTAHGSEYSRSIVERAWADAVPLVAVDAQRDPRLDGAQSVHALSVRSVIAVPLRAFGGRAVLYLDDRMRQGAFGSAERELLCDLGELVGAAARVVCTLRSERRAARQAQLHARSLEAKLFEHDKPIAGTSMVGESRAWVGALHLARRVAEADTPVLIHGESGTGKELLARFVHAESARRARPFVAENCAALPETLLESALFGHERGAFTGAERARIGLFEAAHTGTLFLDEVAEMSPALQAKLLRVLQDGEVRPVGSEKTRHVDVRLVTATHRDLTELVREQRFREDLYYRVAVVTVELPPLRDRSDDVRLLALHFLKRHRGRKEVRIAPRALEALAERAWPGNVRQLESEIQRAIALCDGVIDLAHLTSSPVDSAPLGLDLRSHMDAMQRTLVRRALGEASGNQTRAAVLLGISRFGLQKMLKRLGFN